MTERDVRLEGFAAFATLPIDDGVIPVDNNQEDLLTDNFENIEYEFSTNDAGEVI